MLGKCRRCTVGATYSDGDGDLVCMNCGHREVAGSREGPSRSRLPATLHISTRTDYGRSWTGMTAEDRGSADPGEVEDEEAGNVS